MVSVAPARSTRTGNQALVREINLSVILNALHDRAPISRAGLAAVTGLNKATVSSLVNELLEAKYVHEIGFSQSDAGGRPAIMLELDPLAGCMIGVEFGPDFIFVALTDFAARILWRRREQTSDFSQAETLNRGLAIIRAAVARAEQDERRILGLGLGVPALLDLQSDGSPESVRLRWPAEPLRDVLEREFGFPIYVDKQANLALSGEIFWGAARGCANALYLDAGQTLNVAIVLDGRVLSGVPGLAGDVGHVTIAADGPECDCGNRGCWRTFSTESAVLRRVRESIADGEPSELIEIARGEPGELSISKVAQAAHANDAVAVRVLKETGRYLGIGLANLISAFNPELIVLGGGLSLANEQVLPEIKREIAGRASLWSRRTPRVVVAAHGTDACVMGGIAVVYQRILSQSDQARLSA